MAIGTNTMLDTGTVPVNVAEGGTGLATLTTYELMVAGTTATGAMQQVSGVGTAGQVLTSAGAAAFRFGQTQHLAHMSALLEQPKRLLLTLFIWLLMLVKLRSPYRPLLQLVKLLALMGLVQVAGLSLPILDKPSTLDKPTLL